jgi:integrase
LWETNYNRAAGRSDYAKQINSLLDEIKAGIDRHYNFELYLATVPKLAHNTIWIYMIPLRRMIAIAINNRWLTYEPFSTYEIAAEETYINYLDREEIRAIMDAPLNKRLELVRNLFLFCIFTRLSFRDMKNLTLENMQVFFDGNPWIITRQQKPSVSSNIR